ncbi:MULTISPECIES: Qat anti-phage system TatD family nuclease QatD [unclassified Devosia]|uniref:Qat anti-phage system TatD family nuclease QatD n=1 Tax=unclassified Devosia TaxID=196773 RepID=UPI00086C3D82|nr:MULTISPECIES: Qat anti-phage system TatD family nuclease QatD [unclassified Devosia]MBN9362833.1 TatD family hydrolase [Devosia sp.]ODS88386.1 MAG: hydrolase TatD [Devosia sp. SCN 66-27]OJX24003.1 MAG: hydrolase TatD [Devosia sp. 66-14]
MSDDDVQSGGVDFHCHLDLYPDLQAAIAKAEAARIFTLTVTTTPKAWPRNHELTRGTRYVRAALGLHPQLVAERAGELALWEYHLRETRYVGEVGLDAGPRFYKSLDTQKQVFRTVLERCAEAGGKILTVHSVRSVPMVLDMIECHLPRNRGVVVLHWFTGSKAEARRAVALGCYFSINTEMTRSERGRALIAELPMDRLLTETDGPFTQIDGRPTEPADSRLAVEAIARVRNLTTDAIDKAVRTNLQTLLR